MDKKALLWGGAGLFGLLLVSAARANAAEPTPSRPTAKPQAPSVKTRAYFDPTPGELASTHDNEEAWVPTYLTGGDGSAVTWFGGTGTENREALGWMLASENPHSGELVWFLQALAANNVARGRAGKGIKSIRDLLQSGMKDHQLHKSLGWGPQYDKLSGITRFASTSAALEQKAVPEKIRAFVDALLLGRTAPTELRGPAGELPPPVSDWSLITSYLQHRNFDKVVAAQLGHKGKSEEQVLTDWGNPRLVAEVDGVSFFARRSQRERAPVA